MASFTSSQDSLLKASKHSSSKHYQILTSDSRYLSLEAEITQALSQKDVFPPPDTQFQHQEKQLELDLSKLQSQSVELESTITALTKKHEELKAHLNNRRRQLQHQHDRYNSERRQEASNFSNEEQKLTLLRQKLAQIKTKGAQEIVSLEEEYNNLVKQNEGLLTKLTEIQDKERAIEEGSSEEGTFLAQVQAMEEEEEELRLQAERFQSEAKAVEEERKSLENLESSKSSDGMFRYVDLFEKIFMVQQFARVEAWIKGNEDERLELTRVQKAKEQLEAKNKLLEEKQKELQNLQQKITQMSLQVREKSTELLNIYDQDHRNTSRKKTAK